MGAKTVTRGSIRSTNGPGQMITEEVKVAALLGWKMRMVAVKPRWCKRPCWNSARIVSACHQIGEQVEAREAEALSHSQALGQQLAQRRHVIPDQRVYASLATAKARQMAWSTCAMWKYDSYSLYGD